MRQIFLMFLLFSSVVFHKLAIAQEDKSPKGADAIEDGRELVNMDFPELTDIREIIKAVSVWTGKNVILDRQVHGKVQIISPKQVTKEEAYQAFLSALNVLNLTPVETGKIIKILPIRASLKDNLKTYTGSYTPRTDEVITQIVPLKYIDAKKIRSTLSRITTASAIIAYEPTNTLIISDSGFKVQRIMDIIQLLDVQTQQSQVAIVPIKYSDAKSIAEKVRQIFTGGKGKSSYHTYKILTDERTNAVIIFGPPRTIKDVRNLVSKFDIRVEDPSRQASIHVRPLDYADAKKLASTLSALTNSGNSRRSSIRSALRSSTKKVRKNSVTSVAEISEGVKISADESSNSLLITGSRAAYDAVNSIVRKMDVKKSQVFIETDVLDIGINNDLNFGTSIFAGLPGGDDNQVATWEAGNMAPLVIGSTESGSGSVNINPTDVVKTFANEFTFGILAKKSVDVPGLGKITPGGIIKMLKSDSNTRVLSSPHILISNNEEGLFSSGKKIFFTSTQVNEQTGTTTPKVETEEVKLQLKIKPNISYSDYVTMTIELDADSLAGTDTGSGLPIISKRKTTQTVTVKNGQTIVISGLVETTEAETFRKIPLLGDLPVIGWLFRNSIIKKSKSNLVIFVTPHIVHGPQDLAEIYKEKLEERDSMLKEWGSDLEGDEFYAALPKLEDGEFKPTEIDVIENERMLELRKGIYRDMGYDLDEESIKQQYSVPNMKESTITVPVSPSGSSGGVDGSGETQPVELQDDTSPLPPVEVESPTENTNEAVAPEGVEN